MSIASPTPSVRLTRRAHLPSPRRRRRRPGSGRRRLRAPARARAARLRLLRAAPRGHPRRHRRPARPRRPPLLLHADADHGGVRAGGAPAHAPAARRAGRGEPRQARVAGEVSLDVAQGRASPEEGMARIDAHRRRAVAVRARRSSRWPRHPLRRGLPVPRRRLARDRRRHACSASASACLAIYAASHARVGRVFESLAAFLLSAAAHRARAAGRAASSVFVATLAGLIVLAARPPAHDGDHRARDATPRLGDAAHEQRVHDAARHRVRRRARHATRHDGCSARR